MTDQTDDPLYGAIPLWDITINDVKFSGPPMFLRQLDDGILVSSLPKEAFDALVLLAPYAGKTTVEWIDADGAKRALLREGWLSIGVGWSAIIKGKIT